MFDCLTHFGCPLTSFHSCAAYYIQFEMTVFGANDLVIHACFHTDIPPKNVWWDPGSVELEVRRVSGSNEAVWREREPARLVRARGFHGQAREGSQPGNLKDPSNGEGKRERHQQMHAWSKIVHLIHARGTIAKIQIVVVKNLQTHPL